jgi:hypothetical protein
VNLTRARAEIPTSKYDFHHRVEYPGRRPGEHHKNAEEGEEIEEALI